MHRLLITALLLASQCATAAPMYKVVDKYGNVTYTDTPPSGNTPDTSTPIEGKPLNVLEGSTSQNYQQSFERHASERQQQRDSAWQTYETAVQQAEQKLAAARKALEQGKVAGDGDFVGVFGNGRQTGVRPSDDYLARKQALKQAATDAEAELNAIKKNKPQLSH